MLYHVYRSSYFPKGKIDAYSCSWLLVALLTFEVCYWPAKTTKNMNFLRSIQVFEGCNQLLLWNKWRIFDTLLLFFSVLANIIASLIRLIFFAPVGLVLSLGFHVLHLYGNVFNWVPKVIWPRLDWFWSVLNGLCVVCQPQSCMELNLHGLPNCAFLWRLGVFLINSLFCFFLWNCQNYLSRDFSIIDWWAISLQSYYTS